MLNRVFEMLGDAVAKVPPLVPIAFEAAFPRISPLRILESKAVCFRTSA